MYNLDYTAQREDAVARCSEQRNEHKQLFEAQSSLASTYSCTGPLFCCKAQQADRFKYWLGLKNPILVTAQNSN
jgi:hypothetical protein